LRLLFFTTHDTMGGSELLWINTCKYALNKGHKVGICIDERMADNEKVIELIEFGAILHIRKLYLGYNKGISRIIGYVKRKYNEWKIFKGLRKFKPSFILINQGNSAEILDYLPAYFGKFRKLRIHYGIIDHMTIKPHVNIQANRKEIIEFYNGAKFCGFVAKDTIRKFEEKVECILSNCIIIRNPINLKENKLIEYPENGKNVKFAIIATIDERKGQHKLVKIFSQSHWKTRNWQLVIYGKGTEEEEQKLRNAIDKNGLEDRILMKGFENNICSVWSKCHINVLPSLMESAPISIVEAMICGRPSIATDVGGVAEWIDDETGFLAAQPTEEFIAAALERAWNKKDNWEEMGKKAHKKAIKMVGQPEQDLLSLISKFVA